MAALLALAALADAGVSNAAGPTRLVKGPYLTGLTSGGADVRFELDADGRATVELAPERAPTALRRFDDPAASALHDVHLTGLQPATRYVYLVRIGQYAIGKGTFTTAPRDDSGAPLDFVVYGDTRSDPEAHQAVVRLIGASSAQFLVNTGDVVADGGAQQDWDAFFEEEAPIMHDRPMFLTIGNHELYDDQAGANFARYFGNGPRPYGTARLGNARFFFLNGMDDWSSGDERQWFDRELAKADGEPGLQWRIVVVHHGPWSAGPHGPNEKLVEANVPDLLARHHVDLVLSGHDHIYERGDAGSVKYVVSGGGGAPLYRKIHPTPFTRKVEATYHAVELTTQGDAMHLLARRIDGSILDKCSFRKGGPWDCDASAAAPRSDTRTVSPAHTGPAAPAGGSAPPAPVKASCGCAVPGVANAGEAGGALAALGLGVAVVRRRRRRGAARADA